MTQQLPQQQPVQQVTVIQQPEKTHANAAEQVLAGIIGLTLSGPVGAAASWGALKAFNGKWAPWMLLGIPMAPICGFASLALTGAILGGIGGVMMQVPEPPAYEAPATNYKSINRSF